MLRVDSMRMRESFEKLSSFGMERDGSVNRIAFSQAFLGAREWLEEEFRFAGLETRVDAAGSIFGRLSGAGEVVMVGSHLDSVPNGGRFDGALGVAAGLECVRVLQEKLPEQHRPVEVAAFSDEEGSYYSLLGSHAMTGTVDVESLGRLDGSQAAGLEAALGRSGSKIGSLRDAERCMGEICAYLELHIEQGPRLASSGIPIGIVDSIVGLVHYTVTFNGEADHAGTTPMSSRRDALLGAAEFVLAASEWVTESHPGSTFNAGSVDVSPGAVNIVPREAKLSIEFRGATPQLIADLGKGILSIGEQVARGRQLSFAATHMSTDSPVSLSRRVRTLLEETAKDLGFDYAVMHSGAGHDAQAIAPFTDAGVVFVPSVGGKSHCPEEETRWEDAEKGASVLLNSLARLATDWGV